MPSYEDMDHASLMRLRDMYGPDSEMGQFLAPYEHQAFAREWTKESPWIAPLSLSIATPAYYLAKQSPFIGLGQTLGLVGKQATPASFEQLQRGYKGIGQGLASLFK